MPLPKCPWMAARCAHYASPCADPQSVHCHYVKNTTASAAVSLQQLLSSRGFGPADPIVEKTIRDLQDFLAGRGP